MRDLKTLTPQRGAPTPEGASFDAFSKDDRFAVATSREPARTQLARLTEDLQGEVVLEVDQYRSATAFSPSGDRLAFACEGSLKIVDGHTGEVRLMSELLKGTELNAVAFHREDVLVDGIMGMDFEPCNGWAVDTMDGHITAKFDVNAQMGGSSIMHIHSNPETGVVVLTAATSGQVTAFSDKDWTQARSHKTSGGNWGTLVVRHAEGAARACISGMSIQHSR